MDGGTMVLIFCLVFVALLFVFVFSILAVKNKLTGKSRRQVRPRLQLNRRKENRESTYQDQIAEVQKQLLETYKNVATAPPISQVIKEKQKQKNESFFDKFKASKTKRKQAPSSAATPNVKSLRGRKC